MLFTIALLAAQAAVGLASPYRRDGVAYYAPNANGGSELDLAAAPLGEPLNVIISGLSSPDVLTDAGFLNFAQSIGLSTECFGLHLGGPQSANLGDGNGWVNQTYELRQDYGDAGVGTCLESLIGGNHLRLYRQNGSEADSGALFLAVSKEEPVTESHNIVPDGYDIGRDALVAAAIASTTSFDGITYATTAENITGLLAPGADGVNHNISQDGVVKLLTVIIQSHTTLKSAAARTVLPTAPSGIPSALASSSVIGAISMLVQAFGLPGPGPFF